MVDKILFESGDTRVTSSHLWNRGTSTVIAQIERYEVQDEYRNKTKFKFPSLARLIKLALLIGCISVLVGIGLISNYSEGQVPVWIRIAILSGGALFLASIFTLLFWPKNYFTTTIYNLNVWTVGGHQISIKCGDIESQRNLVESLQRAIAAARSGPLPSKSVAEELRALFTLQAEGILGSSDMERAKDLFLGKPIDRRAAAIAQIEQLHQLYKQGVLSEGEFNMKKWEVLSKN